MHTCRGQVNAQRQGPSSWHLKSFKRLSKPSFTLHRGGCFTQSMHCAGQGAEGGSVAGDARVAAEGPPEAGAEITPCPPRMTPLPAHQTRSRHQSPHQQLPSQLRKTILSTFSLACHQSSFQSSFNLVGHAWHLPMEPCRGCTQIMVATQPRVTRCHHLPGEAPCSD